MMNLNPVKWIDESEPLVDELEGDYWVREKEYNTYVYLEKSTLCCGEKLKMGFFEYHVVENPVAVVLGSSFSNVIRTQHISTEYIVKLYRSCCDKCGSQYDETRYYHEVQVIAGDGRPTRIIFSKLFYQNVHSILRRY
jgi:hypothetical protein